MIRTLIDDLEIWAGLSEGGTFVRLSLESGESGEVALLTCDEAEQLGRVLMDAAEDTRRAR